MGKIIEFAKAHKQNALYEPERHPGVEYRFADLKVTCKVFQSGSITITAPSVKNIEEAADRLYPLVLEYQREPAFRFRKPLDRSPDDTLEVADDAEMDDIEIDEGDEPILDSKERSMKR